MNHYEEEIMRLNRKLSSLMDKTEKTLVKNLELESKNEKFILENEELKNICAKSSQLNVDYRMQLDKEINEKEEFIQANRKLKTKMNQLSIKCSEQNDKIKVLQTNLQKLNINSMNRISDVSNVSNISNESAASSSSSSSQSGLRNSNDLSENTIEGLQNKIKELEEELHQAHATIEDMEFELSSIDYLESENKRLQKEIQKYKDLLENQQKSSEYAETETVNYGTTDESINNLENDKDTNEVNLVEKRFSQTKIKDGDLMAELRAKQESSKGSKFRKSFNFQPL